MKLSGIIDDLQTILDDEGDKETFIRINDAVIPIDHVAFNLGLNSVGVVAPMPLDLDEYFF